MDIRKKNFVVAALRRATYRWPGRYRALKKAHVGKNAYFCAHCPEGVIHPKNNVQVDHRCPIVPVEGWDNFDGLIDRLFCDENEHQILCKEHHKIKTSEENTMRAYYAKKSKDV